METVLSIIIAVHNNQNTIKRCINSFYEKIKNNHKIEVICINDHSTDKSLEIISKYKKIKVFNSPKHGLGPSRNCGIKHANAKFIWFIDADDELCGETIDDNLIESIRLSDTDLFLLGVEKVTNRGNKYLVNKVSGIFYFNKNIKGVKEIFLNNIFNNSWNKLYKRELIQKNNLKFDDVSSVEDILFNCKYLEAANNITVINKVFYKYYIYSKTSTKWNWMSDKLDVSVDMLEKLLKLSEKNSSVNRTLISKIATDTLIGNEINNFISKENELINFTEYKNKFRTNKMKFIRKHSNILSSRDIIYFIKACIANSAILSYLYVKKMVISKH